MTCCTPGCGRPVLVKKRGLCSACYQRERNLAGPFMAGNRQAYCDKLAERTARDAALRAQVQEAVTARKAEASLRTEESRGRAEAYHERMKAGETMAEIARADKITRERIRQVLRQHGFPTRVARPINGTKAALSPRSRSLVRILSILDQFIQVGTKDECWPWTGGSYAISPKYQDYLMPSGIRAFDPLDAPVCRRTTPYRVVYLFNKGPIPQGMTVDHLCYNPLCCNPNHLQLLTRAENSARKNPAKIEARRKAKAVSA